MLQRYHVRNIRNKIGETIGQGRSRYFLPTRGTPSQSAGRGQIFGHFVRLDEAGDFDSEGSGLGLAIAEAIISQHGGQITAGTENGRNIFKVTLLQEQGLESKADA